MSFGGSAALRVTFNSGDAFGDSATLAVNAIFNSTSNQASAITKPMSSGAATVDLTALPQKDGSTFDATGLQVLAVAAMNPNGTAGHDASLHTGASNGFPVGSLTLSASLSGAALLLNFSGQLVDSTHKTLDISGTGAEKLDLVIVVG